MILTERPELHLKDDVVQRRPAYFWWVIANALALCFAVGSWLACLEVFGNPEVSRNYEILRKIGRVQAPKLFAADDIPEGVMLDACGLYSRFYPSSSDQLKKFNARLMRNYLTNFSNSEAVVHVVGDFKIEKVRNLASGDFISSGILVRARAMVKPGDGLDPAPYPVWVDCLIPMKDAGAAKYFTVGDMLSLGEPEPIVTLLNVSRAARATDPILCFTVIPLANELFCANDETRIVIKPPENVLPSAVFPLMR